MALPNIFYPSTPNTKNCWGYTFELTPDHLSHERSQALKHSYDVLGEECLVRLRRLPQSTASSPPNDNEIDPHQRKPADVRKRVDTPQLEPEPPLANDKEKLQVPDGNGSTQEPKPSDPRDLYALLQQNHKADEKLNELWTQINTIPEWVDWDQISRGQEVFYRYGGPALTGLAFQSLLGGMGAARVVEVLARTGGFGTKVARRRLYETTQHILQCTKSLESIQPGGAGFASTIRVRLLHAAVRLRIMKLTELRPEYYSVEEYGIPINDLDSIATIVTFSSSLIWLSFPRQGIFLRKQEIIDYIALWRYIAYLIGSPTDDFSTPDKAKRAMESLLYTEIKPSEMSGVLANNIILSLRDRPPTYASAGMLIASARWLNGNALCDALNLPRPSLYYWALMAGQCTFFVIFTYLYRSVPSWDQSMIERKRKLFYAIIVESKTGLEGKETLFEFKYVPEYSTLTSLDKDGQVELRERGVDQRNLKYFIIGLVAFVLIGWLTSWMVRFALRNMIRAVGNAWSSLA